MSRWTRSRIVLSMSLLAMAGITAGYCLRQFQLRAASARDSISACSVPAPLFSAASFRVSWLWADEARGLHLYFTETDPGTGQDHDSEWEATSSFVVHHPVARHANEIYLSGRLGTDDILEKWVIEEVDGAYAARRPVASPAIGVPVAEGSTSVHIVGSSYVAPGERRSPAIARSELYRNSMFGGIRHFQVDPEGRFILLISDATSALMLVLLNGRDPPPCLAVATAQEWPHLANCNQIEVFRHKTEGRKYIVTDEGAYLDGKRIVLSDNNNDGEFESIEMLSQTEWEAKGYSGDVWADDYLHIP